MSDSSRGPGWWQDSEGRWHPVAPAPPPAGGAASPGRTSGNRTALASLIGVLAVLLIGGVGYLALRGDETNANPTTSTTDAVEAFPVSTETRPTEAPVTEPSATRAPITEAPTTEAPVTEAPTTRPSAGEPPRTTGAPVSSDAPPATAAPPASGGLTPTQQEAADVAAEYVEYVPASRRRLIQVLTLYGDYTEADATVAVDSLDIDYGEQAVLEAQPLIDYSTYSRQGLIDELVREGGAEFTVEQATYAGDHVAADWNAEATEAAEKHLATFDYQTCEGLVEHLTLEKLFPENEARHGAEEVSLC